MNLKTNRPKVSYEIAEEHIEVLAEAIFQKMKSLASVAPSPKNERDILWMDDAVKFLHLAKPTIYGLISKGKLPYYKRGRKVYFLKSELEQWLLDGKRKTQSDIDKEADDYLNSKLNNSNRQLP